MFVRDKIVAAEGVFATEAEARASGVPIEVRYRSTTNFPIYKCRCLNCPTFAENISELKLAEEMAKGHAEWFRHRVRLAMDLKDIDIEIINGEERVD